MYIQHFPQNIIDKYEIYDYRHAIAILSTDFSELFSDICYVLEHLRITKNMIRAPGGNESQIPKEFSQILRPLGWETVELTAKVMIDDTEVVKAETHKIDYVKGRVAFDLEWNSKDQTFDRDLYSFRAFYDYNKISVGVIVTRSTNLRSYFITLGNYTDQHGVTRPISGKYGASTTHMNKLLPRLQEGRSGGCPVVAFGITRAVIVE
jgi:CRISPR-associated protein Csd2